MSQNKEELIIKSLSDLLNILGNSNLDQGSSPTYYFRGESIYGRPLIPKLIRNAILLGEHGMPGLVRGSSTIIDIQKRLLNRLKRYAVHLYLQNNRPWQGEQPSVWEWLSVAQHHGLPTLLSDWTINPLVALYFSAWKHHGDTDGVFYVMKLHDKDTRDSKGLTVRVGQHEGISYNRKDDKNKSTILPEIANNALIVVPLVFTRRIEAQSARFIYAGYAGFHDVDEFKIKETVNKKITVNGLPLEFYSKLALDELPNKIERPWKSLTKCRVPKEDKATLLRQLRNAQIHHGTLFSDLDGYADYLRMGGD